MLDRACNPTMCLLGWRTAGAARRRRRRAVGQRVHARGRVEPLLRELDLQIDFYLSCRFVCRAGSDLIFRRRMTRRAWPREQRGRRSSASKGGGQLGSRGAC